MLGCDAFRESAHGVRHSGVLTGWEKASLFRWDLLVGFVLIPAVLMGVGRVLPRLWRVASSVALSIVVVTVLVVEETVRCATGAFQSAKVLAAAALWALRSHDGSLLYIPAPDRIELTALIALIVLSAAVVGAGKSFRWMNIVALVLVGIGVIGTLVLSVPRAPVMVWNQAMLVAVSRAVLDPPATDVSKLQRTIPELHGLYCELSHVPPPASSQWLARAQNYNVLFFVLETAPAQVFDPARDELGDMPNARRLRLHSFVASEHFTTLAFTSSAVFSLFTSLYPHGPGPIGQSVGEHNVELPGMIRALRSAGYQTGFYGYVWKASQERDDRMLESLGFENIVGPDIDIVADRDGLTTFQGPLEYVERHDREVLGVLLRDIRRWTSARQKFAAAFFPELGHDPWRELKGAKSRSVAERGHALAVYQDAWLGKLMEELERDGVLHNTIIVVTADHGLRMVRDGSDAPMHMVASKSDDTMIRVPLLIYVPRVLRAPVRLDWPTSHIDVSPTVLDLLGVQQNRKWEQGTDLWNPELRHRRLFLTMDLFGAAAGYSESGSYYLRSGTQTVFKASSAHFEDNDALLQDAEESRLVRKVLAEEDGLQQALLFHLFNGEMGKAVASAHSPGDGHRAGVCAGTASCLPH